MEQFFKMGLRPKPRAGLPPPAASVRPVVGFGLVGRYSVSWVTRVWFGSMELGWLESLTSD